MTEKHIPSSPEEITLPDRAFIASRRLPYDRPRSWAPQEFKEFESFDLRRPSSITSEIVLSRTLVSTERLHRGVGGWLGGRDSVESRCSQEMRPTRSVSQDIAPARSGGCRSTVSETRPLSWSSATNRDQVMPSRSKSMFSSFRKRKKSKKKDKKQTDRSQNDRPTDGQTDGQAGRQKLTEAPTSEVEESGSRPGSMVSEGRPVSMSAADQRTSVCTTSSGASSHSTPSSGNNG